MLLAIRAYRPYQESIRDTIRDGGSESQESRGADKSARTTGGFAAELAARGKPISPQKPVCGTFLPLRDRDDRGMLLGRKKDIWRESDSATFVLTVHSSSCDVLLSTLNHRVGSKLERSSTGNHRCIECSDDHANTRSKANFSESAPYLG